MLSRPQPWDLPRPMPVMIAAVSAAGSVTAATPSNWVRAWRTRFAGFGVVAADGVAGGPGDQGLQVQAGGGGAVDPPLLGVGAAQRDHLLAAALRRQVLAVRR